MITANDVRKKLKEIKGNNVNYGKALLDINSAYYVVPRKYNAMHSMTRYFQHEYMEVEYFLNVESAEVFFDSQMKADGKVITLFSRKAIQQDAVIEKVEELRRKNLVVVVPEKKISCEKELVEYELCPGDNRARKTVSIMACALTNMTSELSDKLEDNIDVMFSFNIFKLKRKYVLALCKLGFHNTLVNVVGSDVLDNMLSEGYYELYELGECLDTPYIIDDYMIDDIKELIYWYDNNDIGHLLLDYDIMCDKLK